MITDIPYEDMQRLAATHRCTCGAKLTVAWGGVFGVDGFILRCAADIDHDMITAHSKEKDWYDNLKRGVFKMDSNSLTMMTQEKMLERIKQVKFPKDLSVKEEQMLAEVARSYGLDPLMGELSIYQGRAYVQIDGRYRKAQETNELDGVDTRPATQKERIAWDIPDGDYFFRAEIYRKGASRAFVGWGRVRKDEIEKAEKGKGADFLPLATNPQRMAEKRAEAQGLRKAFHIPLPSAEDISPLGGETTMPDYDIEGEAVELDDVPVPDIEPESKTDPDWDELKRDPEPETEIEIPLMEKLSDMQKIIFEKTGWQPTVQLKKIGYNSWLDVAAAKLTPERCYEKLMRIYRQEKEAGKV